MLIKLISIALASSAVHSAAAQNIFQAANTGNVAAATAATAIVATSSSSSTTVNQPCIDYCTSYFDKCKTYNYFLYQPSLTGSKASKNRKLGESNQPRSPQTSDITAAALETCHQTCMTWPRDQDPAQYSWLDPQGYENNFNSNMGGDIFACRQKHLSLISDDRNEAAFHCPHATNPSTAICRDSFVNGYTPYELQRQGQQTRHRVGYCDLSGQNTIADCVDQNLDDESFVQALQFLPATVQIIFMSGNPTITDGSLGITKLTEDIFKANLKSPSTVQAIYLNDNSIADIHENALRGLVNLKIFCINMNPLPSIPGKLFQYSPNLLQFEYFMTGQGDNTALSEFPVNLFSNTKKIERIVIYGHKRVTSLPSGLLDGLSNLNIFTIVDSGLTSDGIPDDLFHDCTSLQFWDFFGNSMTTFDGRWFNGIWEKNLIRVAMWGQCIPDPDTMTIDTTTAFDGMDSIQFVYFHDNAGVVIDPAIFADKKDFVALTFTGDRLTSFCPPP